VDADGLITSIVDAVVNPALAILFVATVILALWGGVRLIEAQRTGADLEEAKRHLFWSVVGVAVMLSAYGLLQLALGTFQIPEP
jgi:hypothetical protein